MNNCSKREGLLIGMCLLLCAVAGFFLTTWLREGIYLSAVAGKVSMLIEIEESARSSPPSIEIARCAAKAMELQASGAGSSADIILNLVASNTVHNLCALLRRETGVDIGDNPKEWMSFFSTNSSIHLKSSRTDALVRTNL